MSGAKQLSFCGAGMHRSEAEGRFVAAEPEGRASVCARALLIGVDKTCDWAVLSASKRTDKMRLLLEAAMSAG